MRPRVHLQLISVRLLNIIREYEEKKRTKKRKIVKNNRWNRSNREVNKKERYKGEG